MPICPRGHVSLFDPKVPHFSRYDPRVSTPRGLRLYMHDSPLASERLTVILKLVKMQRLCVYAGGRHSKSIYDLVYKSRAQAGGY